MRSIRARRRKFEHAATQLGIVVGASLLSGHTVTATSAAVVRKLNEYEAARAAYFQDEFPARGPEVGPAYTDEFTHWREKQ
jgi:hypothetical protein